MPLMTHHRAASATIAIALSCLVFAPQSHAPRRYTVRDLGTLGGTVSVAQDINDAGSVVGISFLADDETVRAFGVPAGGKMRDLGTLGGSLSVASGVNDEHQAVGTSYTAGDTQVRAFLRDRKGIHDLGTLGGDASIASGINNAGVIVGASQTRGNRAVHAARYENGTWRDILPTYSFSAATAISSGDATVGYFMDDKQDKIGAFLAKGDRVSVLPSFGGTVTVALGVNKRGQAVGFSETRTAETYHAFTFSDNRLTDLGTLGGESSAAYGINNNGQIVGSSERRGDEIPHGFLHENGKMLDLNTRTEAGSGFEIVTATAINDRGQIAATGIRGQEAHAVRLDPSGENALTPGAATLLGLSVAALVLAWGVKDCVGYSRRH